MKNLKHSKGNTIIKHLEHGNRYAMYNGLNFIGVTFYYREDKEDKAGAEANAILFASADELLNACIKLREFIIDNIHVLPNSEEVRLIGLKAICNATGETKKIN